MSHRENISTISGLTEIDAEKRLVAAVIQQAILDATRDIKTTFIEAVQEQLTERVTAVDWLVGDSVEWFALIAPAGRDAGELHELMMNELRKDARHRIEHNLDRGLTTLRDDNAALGVWLMQLERLTADA